MPKTLVFTATYNESDNAENILNEIFQHLPDAEVLVVDDSSPDGTGAILDRLSTSNPAIHVIHRPSKLGLGTAHLLAMKYAIHHEYDQLITMDADFSHNPKYLPVIKQLLEDNHFVIDYRKLPQDTLPSASSTILHKLLSSLSNHHAYPSEQSYLYPLQ